MLDVMRTEATPATTAALDALLKMPKARGTVVETRDRCVRPTSERAPPNCLNRSRWVRII
jgi:hypothetical protein